jgi:hypothetical protein
MTQTGLCQVEDTNIVVMLGYLSLIAPKGRGMEKTNANYE